MRRVFFFLSMALVPAGCATNAAAMRALPDLSVASLAAPDEAPARSGWSDVDLNEPAGQDQDPSYDPSRPWVLHLTLMVGERSLDEDDWEPFDSQTIYGVELDKTSSRTGHGIEAGVFYSHDEDDDVIAGIAGDFEVTTFEFYGGVRHTFRPGEGGLHPFVSAGLVAGHGRFKVDVPGGSESDGEIMVGAYARAGLLWDLTDRVRIGGDYRYVLSEDLKVFGENLSNDHGEFAFSVGYAF